MGWFPWSYKWYSKVLSENLEDKAVYWLVEPSVVENRHHKEAIDTLLKRFKYVMTWNEELQKLNRVFELNSVYNWQDDVDLTVFSDRKNMKLLTNISGNKTSNVVGELYSERKKVIEWFEKNHPEEFEFYGYGWNRNQYSTYLGTCKDKKKVYSKFKFALCLENLSMKGYVTEKLFDCFTAGIVPIYKGDVNIRKYFNKPCFIDYNDFKNVEEMYSFLKNMDDKTYEGYLKNIKDFVTNTQDIAILSVYGWIQCFEKMSIKNTGVTRFIVCKQERIAFKNDRRYFMWMQCIGKIKMFIYKILVLLKLVSEYE